MGEALAHKIHGRLLGDQGVTQTEGQGEDQDQKDQLGQAQELGFQGKIGHEEEDGTDQQDDDGPGQMGLDQDQTHPKEDQKGRPGDIPEGPF